jgi:hypothetical protein
MNVNRKQRFKLNKNKKGKEMDTAGSGRERGYLVG